MGTSIGPSGPNEIPASRFSFSGADTAELHLPPRPQSRRDLQAQGLSQDLSDGPPACS